MLNKKILIGIFIVIVAILGSFLYLNESPKEKLTTTKENTSLQKIENPDESCGCQEPDPNIENIIDITSPQSNEKGVIKYQ